MNTGNKVVVASVAAPREFIKWIEEMDKKLLNAMIDESRLGNGVNNNWTT